MSWARISRITYAPFDKFFLWGKNEMGPNCINSIYTILLNFYIIGDKRYNLGDYSHVFAVKNVSYASHIITLQQEITKYISARYQVVTFIPLTCIFTWYWTTRGRKTSVLQFYTTEKHKHGRAITTLKTDNTMVSNFRCKLHTHR